MGSESQRNVQPPASAAPPGVGLQGRAAAGGHPRARAVAVAVALVTATLLAALARSAGLPGSPLVFSVLWAAGLLAAQALAGRRALRALLGPAAGGLGSTVEWALGWCTGVLLAGYAVTLLAFAGQLNPPAITAVVAVLAAWGLLAPAAPRRRSTRDAARRTWRLLPRPAQVLVAAVLLVELAVVLLPTLYYDTLVYHYAVPEQYLRHGGFFHMPGMIYACFAFLVDLLNVVGLAWDATGVASNIFNAAFGVAMLPLLADFAARTVGHRAAAGAVLVWVTSPFVAILDVLQTNDMPVLVFGLAAIHVAWTLRRTPSSRALVVSALLAGGALFSKNVAVSLVLPAWGVLVMVVAWQRVGRGSWTRPRAAVAVVALGLLPAVVALPTFVKNAWLTGNPIMPAGWSLLGGRDWSALEHASFMEEMKTHPLAVALFAAGPRALAEVFLTGGTVLGREWMGAWVVALLPALVFVKRHRRAARSFLVFAFILAVAWSVSFTTSRFLGPTLMCLVLCAGAGLAWAWARAPRAGRAALGALLVAALPAHAQTFNHGVSIWQGNWMAALADLVDPRAYVEEGTGYAQADGAAAQVLAAGEHVLMLGEGRTFHLRAPVIPTSAMNLSPVVRLLREGRTAPEVAAALREMGVGAILLRPNEWGRLAAHYAPWRLSQEEMGLLGNFLRTQARLVFQAPDGRTLLYRLEEPGGDATSLRGTPSPG